MFPRSGIDAPASPAVVEKILMLNGRLGEGSPFHESFGVYVEAIHKDVVVLPKRWDNRLVAVTVEDGSEYGRTGFCLDPVDLCASKAIAGRAKDRVFVAALVDEGSSLPPRFSAASTIRDRVARHLPRGQGCSTRSGLELACRSREFRRGRG